MSGLYAHLARLEAERRPAVLATVIDTGGSTPRLAGSQMAVEAEATLGTVGGGAFEHAVIARARALLVDPRRRAETWAVHLTQELGMCCGGKMTVFMQKLEPSARLLIYGAGHVGTALAQLAAAVDFAVTVVDGRAEWADPARFPAGVEVVDAEPEDHVHLHPPAPTDFVVIVTHDHPLDEALVRALAPRPLRYLGLIGSRGKWARFRKRLLARGLEEAQLGRVRCPVGLDIGAETPAEIAVSILAQLIECRRAHAPVEAAGAAPEA